MKNTRGHSSLYNFSLKNRRGISSIIATLILILLTIVLIGIVWVVVSGIVTTSTKQINSGAQCSGSAVQITAASCTQTGGDCNVSIQRTLGSDTIGGVRVVFVNAAGNSSYNDTVGNVQTLGYANVQDWQPNVSNVSEIDAAVYFTDAAGTKNPCPEVKFTTIAIH